VLTGINRVRLQAMTDHELRSAMRKLSREWEAAGHPGEDEMPREMLARYIALKAERSRRGYQLYLF